MKGGRGGGAIQKRGKQVGKVSKQAGGKGNKQRATGKQTARDHKVRGTCGGLSLYTDIHIYTYIFIYIYK